LLKAEYTDLKKVETGMSLFSKEISPIGKWQESYSSDHGLMTGGNWADFNC
jgi:hypothetical protein